MIIQHQLNKGGGDTPTLTLDYVPNAGNYMVAFVTWNEDGGGTDFTPNDSAWTLQEDVRSTGNLRAKAFWKLAGASEPTTISGTLGTGKAWIMCVAEISDYIFNEDSSNDQASGKTGFTDYLTLNKTPGVYFGFIANKRQQAQISWASGWNQLETDSRDGGSDAESITAGLYAREITAPEPAQQGSATASSSTTWVGINFGWSGPRVYVRYGTLNLPFSQSGIDAAEHSRIGAIVSNLALSGTARKGAANILFERVTDVKFEGAASAKITTYGTQTNEGIYTAFTPVRSGKHTISAYLQGSGTVRMRITNSTGLTNVYTSPDIVLDNINWNRAVFTTNVNLSSGTGYRLYIETSTRQGTAFWVDAVQVESRNVASPFYPGIRPSGLGPVGQALKAAKPAGLIMNYDVIDGQTFQMLRDGHGGRLFSLVKSDYATFQDARDDLPL